MYLDIQENCEAPEEVCAKVSAMLEASLELFDWALPQLNDFSARMVVIHDAIPEEFNIEA